MSYRVLGEGILISSKKIKYLEDVEAIIFDCDNTLIDVSNSYNLVTKLVANIILNEVYGITVSIGRDVDRLIKLMKMLGGFNDDLNIVSIIIQTMLTFSPIQPDKPCKLARIDISKYLERVNRRVSEPDFASNSIQWLEEKAERLYGDYAARKDFEDMLDEIAVRRDRLDTLRKFREEIHGEDYSYPLGRLFDEIFLGERGVWERIHESPRYVVWEGAIRNDKVLIREETLIQLLRRFGDRMGILTGRGRWETEYTLKSLIRYFNLEASLFTRDLPSYDKPNPRGLIELSHTLNSKKILYVGDSAEDLMMVREASKHGLTAIFAAVLTNDYALDYFMRKCADVILNDVNLLPRALAFRAGKFPWP